MTDSKIDFDLPDEIKKKYATLVQDKVKSLQKFQEKLACVDLAYKAVLEENIKLHAMNEDLKEEVRQLSYECSKSNVLNTDVFPGRHVETQDNGSEKNLDKCDDITDEEVIEPSPEKLKSRMRLQLSGSKVSKKSCSDKSLEENLGKGLSPSLEQLQGNSKACSDATQFDKYEAQISFSETYFSKHNVEESFDDGHREKILNFPDPESASCVQPPARKFALLSYDCLPEKVPKESSFIYQERPVRKKAEKAKLKGFVCEKCADWFDNCSLSEMEKNKFIEKCSKHRGRFPINQKPTPESFWNPLIGGSSDED